MCSRLLRTLALSTLLLTPAAVSADDRQPPVSCTYRSAVWNTTLRESVGEETISHPYAGLRPGESDLQTGCTVCSEDQVTIVLPGIEPFSVCHTVAPAVRAVFEQMARDRAPVMEVVGYHVIRSRGAVDAQGNRTQFSNHSYGTAIDVNPGLNGLYDNCPRFGSHCRLIRGGAWRPGVPGTMEAGCSSVRAFKEAGFKWGGEIEGKQKDFMHFSLTGY